MKAISQRAKHAIYLGSLCSISYFAVYIARNVLSAVTTSMLEAGYTEPYIGKLSSLYLVLYAVGQLINGMIGDRIKAKYMVCFGLILAGVTNLLFPILSSYTNGVILIYGMTGFFLSMIYGPMVKVVSENTEPLHATRCSLGYTFASSIGSPAAGVLAMFLTWQSVFFTSSIFLFLMGGIGFLCFTLMERKKIVQYGQYKPQKK
ncbi:MAG: MFS transporter [Clostridia bacterium]|nr:MFS transporter [Clostridia bacterium]